MKPTVIKDKLSTTPPMHGRVEKCKGAKLLAEDISCKSRLDRPLHERMSGPNEEITLTCTTFVLSRQSMQLTRKTPFC